MFTKELNHMQHLNNTSVNNHNERPTAQGKIRYL